ncbi:MAG: hypothetical protein DRP83_08380 [Planctomycetota bacterium]|nr:MAG: hypothetical protein DRP83_08380 [Planctomycetota bacterium]
MGWLRKMPNEQENPQAGSDQARNIEKVIMDDGRYRLEAFNFLHEGLARAVKDVHGAKAGQGDRDNHISGQKLCESLRDLARERYGLMAPVILRHWGVQGSIDFGQMVYLLIEHGFMRRTEEDSLEDFRDVFDLGDFDTTHSIRLKEDK